MKEKKEGKLKGWAKETATIIAAAGIGAGAAAGTSAAIDGGKAAVDYFTATEKRKAHFWSLPKECYVWNGKPVNKKKGGRK